MLALVTAAKEHASYGEIMESKVTLLFTRHWPEVLGCSLSYYYQLLSPGGFLSARFIGVFSVSELFIDIVVLIP